MDDALTIMIMIYRTVGRYIIISAIVDAVRRLLDD